MTQRPTTQQNKNNNTNKKFYPKKKTGKKYFWKNYKNSSTNKNETQDSHHTFSTKGEWYDKKHNKRSNNYNSKKKFYPQNNNKKWNNNGHKINSVPFRLKNFPDSERTVYDLKKKFKRRRFFLDPLFLQQYSKNRRTGACLYVKPPSKHNIIYPFLLKLNLNLVNEHIQKR